MIELEAVHHRYGTTPVLDGIDLHVERGEFVGLVGPNGAGKTTLLQTINGIVEPDSGTVRIEGDDSSDLSSQELSRRIATVPQTREIGFAFTAEQIVEMGRTPHRSRMEWSIDGSAVDAALRRTNTASLRDRRVDELSGGERQRVLLARALAQEAPGLLLDEPTASLDINHQIQVLEQVRGLVRDGRAALAAIHDLDLAARFCDRLVLLANGAIRSAGPPAGVLTDGALSTAFDTETAVGTNPVTVSPTVTALPDPPTRDECVHVIGTGNGAVRAIGALWRSGISVSVGPVPDGGMAEQTADSLGATVVSVPPFSAPDRWAQDSIRDLVRVADCCLVLPSGESVLNERMLEQTTPVVRPGQDATSEDPTDLVETAVARAVGETATADD